MSAHAALVRGAALVERRFAPLWDGNRDGAGAPSGPWLRARVTGNALRELDRLLNLLIDATALALGEAVWPAQRHTANKLSTLRFAIGRADPDHARLCAAGRVRDRLFHRDGGTRRGSARRADRSPPLVLTARELRAIAAMYRRIGDGLLAAATGVPERRAA